MACTGFMGGGGGEGEGREGTKGERYDIINSSQGGVTLPIERPIIHCIIVGKEMPWGINH